MKNPSNNVRRIKSDYVAEHEAIQEKLARRRKGIIRRLTAVTLGVFMFIGFATYTIYNQGAFIQEQQAEKNRLEEELQVLQQEEEELSDVIKNLYDPDYIAEIARRDFYLTKPGETLFQVP